MIEQIMLEKLEGETKEAGLKNDNYTSKSWNCSSVNDFLATTKVRKPSLAMLPH